MKKVLLASFVTFLTACSTINTTNSVQKPIQASYEHFIGVWECQMEGGVTTKNKVALTSGGEATYFGKVAVPSDNPVFQYDIERQGKWSFADNVLNYTFGKGKVNKAHSEEITQKIQTERRYQNAEKQHYNNLNKLMSSGKTSNIRLSVSNFTENAFTVEQKVGDTARRGYCARVMK